MTSPTLDIGMAYCGDWTGLMMTLSGLQHQIFFDGLSDLVSLSVVDNLCDHTAGDVRREVEKFGAKYIPMPSPVGTGPPRDRLFREPGAPWQACIDDHMLFAPGDVAWLAEFCRNNYSDDLYHGVMLASHVGKNGKPTIRWTHCNLQWGEDGLFGAPAINPAAADPDCPAFKIPNGRLAFFMARRASWLGLHPEQRGFGCEGYLPLKYIQAGRSVWCLPRVRNTHVFALQARQTKRPNRWEDRARNYLNFWKDLEKNPHLTFAGIKNAHCRDGRLSPDAWGKIVAEFGIDEADAVAGDPPLVIAQPVAAPVTHPRDVTAWQDCKHRGPEIATRKADLCGLGGKMFPVFSCAIHGECVQNRFCKKQPERQCYLCPDAESTEDDRPRSTRKSGVSVVIPCHNYGRYLPEAIQSVLNQTVRASEIVVIDDASTDDTPDVARRFADRGVRYERIDAHSVYRARQRGMEITKAPYLVFLDADDRLGETYLEEGVKALSDPQTGIAWTDMLLYGDRQQVRRLPPGEIERQNYIHAGAIVRRAALHQSAALECPDPVGNVCADWFAWRAVLRAGWTAQHFHADYFYRQHPGAMHLQNRALTFFEYAHLQHETVPIFLPLSGRDRWWEQLSGWVERQTWPRVEVIAIDNSGRPEFSRMVRRWLAELPCATSYVAVPGVIGLADEVRTKKTHYRAVQRIMPRIYRHLERTSQEYNLVVEDDVLPPDDAIERLLQAMTPRAACVSGVLRSRYHPGYIAWLDRPLRTLPELGTGVEKVHGTGFGCLLFRRSDFSRMVMNNGGSGNFDYQASHDVAKLGRDWLIDWNVRCEHAGISV